MLVSGMALRITPLRHRSWRRHRGRCWKCAYDRAGLGDEVACPECGFLDPVRFDQLRSVGGMPAVGRASMILERCENMPVSRPHQKGEFAESASSVGR